MTMQPDEFKTIRSLLGMTQAAMADAMGVSRKLINDLETRGEALDRRTELAARQLFNDYAAIRAARTSEPKPGDVAIKHAQIIWSCDTPGKPPLKVVGLGKDDDRDYLSSGGACSIDWALGGETGQLVRLLALFVDLTAREGYSPADVHQAFSVIPEYRAAMSVRDEELS